MRNINIFSSETGNYYFSKLSVGTDIIISLGDKTIKTQIESIEDENKIHIKNEEVLKKFSDENLSLYTVSFDALYKFDAEISQNEHNHYLVLVDHGKRIQRRSHIREFVFGNVEFTVLNLEKVEMMYEYRSIIMGDKIDAIKLDKLGDTSNISGGGFLLNFNGSLNSREYIIGKIVFNKKQISMMGQIVRTDYKNKRYGVEFVFLSDENREFIIHKIFELHRKYISILKKDREND